MTEAAANPGARPMSVKLDADTRARIEQLAQARRRTPHWMMREAIAQYVDREEKREDFRQATLQAWDEYRATGEHAAAADVHTWLQSWGTDAEQPAPACTK